MEEKEIAQALAAQGKTAPRVTQEDVEANIDREYFFTAGDGVFGREIAACGSPYTTDAALNVLTFCILVLKNGFTVTGESACASPENFDAAMGYKLARKNAVQRIWPLMGYELKQRLAVR